MLDFADFVAINKFDRRAPRMRCATCANSTSATTNCSPRPPTTCRCSAPRPPVSTTTASPRSIRPSSPSSAGFGLKLKPGKLPLVTVKQSSGSRAIVPTARVRYLAKSPRPCAATTPIPTNGSDWPGSARPAAVQGIFQGCDKNAADFDELIAWKDGGTRSQGQSSSTCGLIPSRPILATTTWSRSATKEIRTRLVTNPCPAPIPSRPAQVRRRWRCCASSCGERSRLLPLHRWRLRLQARKRPTRMFAGEGDAFRTNRRFKRVSEHAGQAPVHRASTRSPFTAAIPTSARTSTAKIGNSGVSIATLDDMRGALRRLRAVQPDDLGVDDHQRPGADHPGLFLQHRHRPADGQVQGRQRPRSTEDEAEKSANGCAPTCAARSRPTSSREDQGQNTCIFSTEFAFKMMGDIQEYFVHNDVRISTRCRFPATTSPRPGRTRSASSPSPWPTASPTSRATWPGACRSTISPQSLLLLQQRHGPEYSVIGRVARRIWAVAMKNRYGASGRNLKYHIQTSGRSLHAQEMDFNDIRTTLQALIAIYDNCNSLHQRLRRGRSPPHRRIGAPRHGHPARHQPGMGCRQNENPNQGAFIIDELTDLVEEAVLKEFRSHRLPRRRAGAPWKPATSAARSRRNPLLRAQRSTTAPTRSSASTPSSTQGQRPAGDRAGPFDGGGKTVPDQAPARLPRPQRRPGPGPAGVKADGHRQRQRLRRPGRCRQILLPQPDHRRPLRMGGQYRRSM